MIGLLITVLVVGLTAIILLHTLKQSQVLAAPSTAASIENADTVSNTANNHAQNLMSDLNKAQNTQNVLEDKANEEKQQIDNMEGVSPAKSENDIPKN